MSVKAPEAIPTIHAASAANLVNISIAGDLEE